MYTWLLTIIRDIIKKSLYFIHEIHKERGGSMKYKRIISILLSMIMAVGLLAGCGGSSQGSNSADAEIQKAIELGFVAEDLQGSYNKQINYAEFCSILDAMIGETRPDCLDEWKARSAAFREADDPMTRIEGMLVFLYAAECAKLDAVGLWNNIPLEDLMPEDKDFWEGVTWDYPLLPDRDELYRNEEMISSGDYAWRCEYPYLNNAVWFAEYYSYGNGKTYFDYDENYMLRLGEPMTRADAIHAVERLYETARFVTYIEADTAKCEVTEESIVLAEKMPAAAYNSLPDWKGHTVKNRTETINSGISMKYTESEIAAIASCGFNFVRAPLDANILFDGTDAGRISAGYLQTMDELVNWCAEYGIHVCFDLHDMPGFITDGDDSNDILFRDKATQDLFCQFWKFMAEHYKNVPSNLLSFNLLNEPHAYQGEELTDAVYSKVMLSAIEEIHSITPERLIFADMLGVVNGIPVEGLADAEVAQAFHPYFMADGTETWPNYVINGFISHDFGTLTLKGDFPAGTEITIDLGMAHKESTLSWQSGGTVVGEFTIGDEAIGENGCVEIGEEGTGGEWRSYDHRIWTMQLTEALKELSLKQNGEGLWYLLNSLKITLPDREILLSTSNSYVPREDVPVLFIADDGSVTSQKEGTLVYFSKDYLKAEFKKCVDFTERTGRAVMVQEFGFNNTIPTETALAAADDFLAVLEELGIPWCSWHGAFGVLTHEIEEQKENYWGSTLLREDTTYQELEDGWLLFSDMMEVYKKYMD